MIIYKNSRHWSTIEILLKRKYHPGIVQCGAHRYFLPRVCAVELHGFSSEKALTSFASNKTLHPSPKLGLGDEASRVSLEQRAQAWGTYVMLLVPILREAHSNGLPATSWLIRLRSQVLAELSKKDMDAHSASHNFCAVITQIEADRVLWQGMVQRQGGHTIGCTALLLDLWIELLGQCYVRQNSGYEKAAKDRYTNFKRASIGDLIECLRVLVEHYMLYKNPPNDPDNLTREQLWASKEHTTTILEKLIETVGNDTYRPWNVQLKNFLQREVSDIECLMQMGKATLADLAPTPNNQILLKWVNMEKFLQSEHERVEKRSMKKSANAQNVAVALHVSNGRQQATTVTQDRPSEYRRSDRADRSDDNDSRNVAANTRSKTKPGGRWGRDTPQFGIPEARVAAVTQNWNEEMEDATDEYGQWDGQQKVAYVPPITASPATRNGPPQSRDYNKDSRQRPPQGSTPPPPPPGGPPNYNLKSFNSHKAEPPPAQQAQRWQNSSEGGNADRNVSRRDTPEVVHGGQRNSLIPSSWSNEQTKAFKSVYINMHAIDDLVGTTAAQEAAKLRPLRPYDENKPSLQATGEQNPPWRLCPDSGRRIWPDGSCNFCANTPNPPANCKLPPTRQYCYGHYQSNHPSSKCYACKLSILYSKDDRVRRAFAPPELKDVRQPPP